MARLLSKWRYSRASVKSPVLTTSVQTTRQMAPPKARQSHSILDALTTLLVPHRPPCSSLPSLFFTALLVPHRPSRSSPPSFSDSSLTSIFIAFYSLSNTAATPTLSLISASSRSMLRSAIVLSTAVDDFKRLMSQEKVSSMMFPPMTLMPSGCNVWLARLTPIPKPPPTKCSPSSCSWFRVKLPRLWKLTHGAFWLPFLRRHYQAFQGPWPLSCCVPNSHIAIANKRVDVEPERQVLSRVLCSWIFTFS